MSSDDLTDILDDKDRVLMAAAPLPNQGTLTEQQRWQAIDTFKAYIDRHKITIEQVARHLGRPRVHQKGEFVLQRTA